MKNSLVMKVPHCRDGRFDCDTVVHDTSEEVVMEKVARHAQDIHGVSLPTNSSYEIRSLIRDE